MNPREPSGAKHEYYLVLSSMSLRYPPQYADICLNDLQDAQLARLALKTRGVKYTIYDRNGAEIKGWDQE